MNTNAAEAQLLAILDDQATRLDRPEKARRDFARDLVAVMADLIRSTKPEGDVITTGSASTQRGILTNGRLT